MKTIYLIHHSHTDIGYTDRQEKISRYHRHYIRAVIGFLDQIETGEKPEWVGYNYTCENYWQVEQFLAHSTEGERVKFEYYVKKGWIDISLTYLNVNDLVERRILQRKISDAKGYGEQVGARLNSAMTADINGASWGYAEAMAETGIENFFTNTHTHHGMFPLYQKQLPFWWETAQGKKILVWSGDHYQIGNDFYLIPNSDQSQQYGTEGYTEAEAERQFALTEARVADLFTQLAEEDYPYDFIPQMISGIVTDNAPPNPRMMEGIHRWNSIHGQEVEIKLVTLNQFFQALRQKGLEFPTYRGDWPDWWADGVGTTPASTKLYRDAQRKYRIAKKLDPSEVKGNRSYQKQAEQELMMYAEHTWSYHSSTSEPWDSNVNELDFRKSAYGTNAHRLISEHLDDILETMGEEPLQMNRQSYFKLINPHDSEVTDVGRIYVKHWETVDDSYYFMSEEGFAELVDCQTGEVIPSQTIDSSKGKEVTFLVTLGAKEERLIQLRRVLPPNRYSKFQNVAAVAADSIADLASHDRYQNHVTSHKIETAFFTLRFDSAKGLASLLDKQSGRELLRPHKHGPFQGVYEKTPIRTNPGTERRRMGRNRKGRIAERDEAKLVYVEVVADGAVYAVVKLDYELVGTQLYSVFLKVYKESPRIAVSVRVQKDNEWAPESLYVPLSFQYGNDSELYIEKAETLFRPAIDQLPGTNLDFYMHDTGLVFTDGSGGLIVGVKDTPLMTLGELEHHDIELASEATFGKNQEAVYAWVMNNIWETNFKVDLAGFYEFAFDIVSVHESLSPAELMAKAHQVDEGIITIAYNPTEQEQETGQLH